MCRRKGYRKLLKKPLKGFRYRTKKFVAPMRKQRSHENIDFQPFLGFDVPPINCHAQGECKVDVCTWRKESILPQVTVRTINVLSLFDGIGTGLYCLQKLGVNVGSYFSAEIDEDALTVQQKNFSGQMIMLGCVTTVTTDMLHCLGRIDLLLGGSPCQDLSLVNATRKGLHGKNSSAPLFYEYARVLQWLQRKAKATGAPFHHLFENTSQMETRHQHLISRTLDCTPVILCASKFVPMARRRLFWTNIHFSCSVDPPQESQLHLQSYLNPTRIAATRSLRTITTSISSQRWGRFNEQPVIDSNGKGRFLEVDEEERLFGFHTDYTKAGNLSDAQRRVLLGKSWCVPVIAHILTPVAKCYQNSWDS